VAPGDSSTSFVKQSPGATKLELDFIIGTKRLNRFLAPAYISARRRNRRKSMDFWAIVVSRFCVIFLLIVIYSCRYYRRSDMMKLCSNFQVFELCFNFLQIRRYKASVFANFYNSSLNLRCLGAFVFLLFIHHFLIEYKDNKIIAAV